MELLLALALLLWVGVAALGIAYLLRGPRDRAHRHGWPASADLLGGPLPEIASEVGAGIEAGGLLFLGDDCAACDAIVGEMEAATEIPANLVTIGGRAPQLTVRATHVVEPASVVVRLREALGVAETPYLWVVHGGALAAGGSVRTLGDVWALIGLAQRPEPS